MKIIKIISALLFSAIIAGSFAAAGSIIGVSPMFSGLAGAGLSLVPTKDGVLGMKIGTLTTGAGVITTIDLQYIPEKIFFVAATQLTGLKAEVLGEGVILDLDATGLTAQGKHRIVGPVTNGYVIDLADGIIKGKSLRLTFTNSAAQTPDIFAFGDNDGSIFIRTLKATVLLNTNTPFEKFACLFLPSLAAGDKITITYEDGTTQIWEREDLNAASGLYQGVPAYQIDNLEGKIKQVQVLVAATQTAYITDFKQA
jgi:hypothetical protein